MITRAKKLLVVVGDANVLRTDTSWAAVVELCTNNQTYINERDEEHQTQ